MSSLILLFVKLVFRRFEFLDRCGFGTENLRGGLEWCAGRVRVTVCGCGAEAGKISRMPAGAGRKRAKNFNPGRTLLATDSTWW